MAEPKDIVISEFQKGIADSAHLGFQDIRNIDLRSYPGIAQPNYATSKASGSTVTDLIKWKVQDPTTGNFYALGNTGKVYKSTTAGSSWILISGNTLTNAHGNGLVVWKGYLFVFRDSNIDVMKISDETWTNTWKTLKQGDTEWHPALVGQDDTIYYGDGAYVGSIAEATAPFVPATASSYTFNDNALDIPSQYRIKCLSQLGSLLMIGTIVGTNNYGDVNVADIFPWDISRGLSSFNTPIRLTERGIHQMISVNNRLYVVAGSQPKVFISDGTNVVKLRKIPDSVIDLESSPGTFVTLYPGAIVNHMGRVFFGVSSGTLSSRINGLGVYSIGEDKVLTCEHQISTGTTAATNNLIIGSLLSNGISLFIGWRDNTDYGIDRVSSSRYGDYAAYLQSAFFTVGFPQVKKKLTQYEVALAKPLANSNDGVRVKYRTNLSAAFTTLDTLDYDTYGAYQAINRPFTKSAITHLQVRVELKGSAQLKELRFR